MTYMSTFYAEDESDDDDSLLNENTPPPEDTGGSNHVVVDDGASSSGTNKPARPSTKHNKMAYKTKMSGGSKNKGHVSVSRPNGEILKVTIKVVQQSEFDRVTKKVPHKNNHVTEDANRVIKVFEPAAATKHRLQIKQLMQILDLHVPNDCQFN